VSGDATEGKKTAGAGAEAQRRLIHGRKHGHKLRPGLKRLMTELLPRLRVTLPAPGQELDPAALFGRVPDDLWLEIGFGAGEHLAWQAEQHPGIGFIGAEVFVNGIASLLRQIRERGLDNLRILEGDGRDLLEALPAASLGRVFILFPDPWRKTRHHKRRVVRRETLDHLARLMKDGAELRLASDHADYLGWMLEAVTNHGAFQWLVRGPEDWRRRPADWPPSRYEQKALAQGRRPTYLRFVRRPRPLTGETSASP
jgi:tRNA (guanine-N7-)-methyltransferase